VAGKPGVVKQRPYASKTGVVKQRPYLIANIRDDLCNSCLSDPKGLGQFSPKPIY